MDLTKEEQAQVDEMFRKLDCNGDKTVSRADLMSILRGLGSDPTEADINHFFSKLDVDNNGQVTINDFKQKAKINRWLKAPWVREKELEDAFKVFDLNGDGFIEWLELKKFLEKDGADKLNENEVSWCEIKFNECDKDKNGRLDWKEFLEFIKM